MKKYTAAIICCICFLLCGAMGVYTYFVSAKLDEAVKANSAASPASVNADYENELAILREANQELSRQITELSMADNDKVCQDVKSFINLYFNRNYFSDDYDYYTSLYAQAEKHCRGRQKTSFAQNWSLKSLRVVAAKVSGFTNLILQQFHLYTRKSRMMALCLFWRYSKSHL